MAGAYLDKMGATIWDVDWENHLWVGILLSDAGTRKSNFLTRLQHQLLFLKSNSCFQNFYLYVYSGMYYYSFVEIFTPLVRSLTKALANQ